MNRGYRVIKPEDLRDNVFRLFDSDWALITAGTMKKWNTMTASWGGLGVLWNKPVAFIFVRPTRYTWQFTERAARFTLSFFPGQYRKALAFCGSHSGRDTDKAAATGLIPFAPAPGCVSFRQARLILECRKLYFQDIDPKRFLDRRIVKMYPKLDFHRMYVGQITRVLSSGRKT
jgi:flavin reductase (DIM6/NTAB) family NADH-FMN oxidoreductase RutF